MAKALDSRLRLHFFEWSELIKAQRTSEAVLEKVGPQNLAAFAKGQPSRLASRRYRETLANLGQP